MRPASTEIAVAPARRMMSMVAMPITGDDEFVVLIARRSGDAFDVVAQVQGGLVDQAVRKAAA